MRGVYAIINTITGFQYIGSSDNIQIRFTHHINELKKGMHINSILQSEFYYYGIKFFKLKVLYVAKDETKSQLYAMETKFIQECDKRYNIIIDAQFNQYSNG